MTNPSSLPAVGVSLLVNLSMLVPLSFVSLSSGTQEPLTEITSLLDDVRPDDLSFNSVSNYDRVGVGTGENLSYSSASLSAAAETGSISTPVEKRVEQTMLPEAPRVVEAVPLPATARLTQKVAVRGASDRVAGGIQGTMDRITHELRQSLEERQTLVMWMFDASLSLRDRRQAITERFETVYQQLGALESTDGLYTAVVAYGDGARVLTETPVKDVRDVIDPVRNLENDVSGTENVFTAVRLAVERWKQFRRNEGRWNKIIVIVTDERGDDADAQLEDVITLCKRYGVRVFVIGNAAVFGQKIGWVHWKYEDGFEDEEPVDQGPETAFPEGLQLPAWGGDQGINRLSASYGPYALTRLCAETGGMYLIAEDTTRRQFDPAVMRDYTPDYRPVRIQQDEIARNPAKAALVSAANMSLSEPFPLPATDFRAFNDTILRTGLADAQMPVARVFYRIDELYRVLQEGEKARASLKEARWRAAFDLAMGRLLAMRTRYDGYNRMLADMKVTPRSFSDNHNNHWRIVPSQEIDVAKVGPLVKQKGEQAKMYLNRVIDEHPGTPWEMLAKRELQTELGWEWQESHEDLAGMDVGNNVPEEQARLLLAEEENMRRQQAPQQAAPPERVRPKL